MQKLFSMFPVGAPGVALLLLRVTVALEFLFDVPAARLAPGFPSFVSIAIAVPALAMGVGVATPLLSALAALYQFARIVTATGSDVPLHATHLITAVALALLGPGGYSVDAKWFGRRVMVIEPRI
jgi:hypothetical protein